MPEKPGGEATPLAHCFQKVGERIWVIMQSDLGKDAAGGAVGEDAVYLPSGPFQIGFSFGVLRLAWHLLGPPGMAQHPEHGVHPPHLPVAPLKVWSGGVKDAVLDIVGGGPAHGEPGESADLEYLAPHQVEDMGTHHMDPAAVPLPLRAGAEQGEILVVSADKQGGKGLVLQPVQLVSVNLFPGPYTPKIASDDHEVVPIHPLQLGKIPCGEPLKITVGVACDPDAHLVQPLSVFFAGPMIPQCLTNSHPP